MHEDPSRLSGYKIIYATFWERAAAWLIDGMLIWIAFSLLGNMLGQGSQNVFWGIRYSLLGSSFQMVVLWLYFALQESGVTQATFGKRILGIKVTDMHGQRISFLQATGRHFGKFISWIILLIGFFMMLWDDKRQTLHDRLAATIVIK